MIIDAGKPSRWPVREHRAAALTALALCGAIAAARWTLVVNDPDAQPWSRHLLERYALGWLAFALALLGLFRVPRRTAVQLILLGAVALQVVAVSSGPTTTDDYQRYVWDGIVQSHGISPYRYAPLAPQLRSLRDPALFPTDVQPDPAAADDGVTDLCTSNGVAHDCTLINRPLVHTIYPPVAEAWFLLVHWLSPDHHRVKGLQVAMALLAIATTAALLAALGRAGRDPRWAAAWAWCPLVWWECGNNAHIEVLGVLLLVAALAVAHRQAHGAGPGRARIAIAGALFGGAVAAKLLPALAGPALLGRRGRIFAGASIAVFLLVYLPHVIAAGTKVLGYLPGYLHEEGYNGTGRFGALRVLVGSDAATWVGAAVFVVVVAVVWVGAARRPPAVGALLLIGTALGLIGPSQPWYALLVVALIAMTGRWEWFGVAIAGYPVYFAGNLGVDPTVMQQRTYLPALLVAGLVTAVRAIREADRGSLDEEAEQRAGRVHRLHP